MNPQKLQHLKTLRDQNVITEYTDQTKKIHLSPVNIVIESRYVEAIKSYTHPLPLTPSPSQMFTEETWRVRKIQCFLL